MATVLLPNTELVVTAWLGQIPGILPAMVATQLPADNSTWAASGFLTVQVLSGAPNIDVPMRAPVIEVSAWATRPGSNKPPWGQANNLIETVLAATYSRNQNRAVVLPGNFPAANVRAVQVVTEPRRIYGDAADYARYGMNLQFWWTGLH